MSSPTPHVPLALLASLPLLSLLLLPLNAQELAPASPSADDASAAQSSRPTLTTPPPSTKPSAAQSHIVRVWGRFNYVCDDNREVIVNLHRPSARVVFENQTYNLKKIDPAKYSDGAVVWWNKGQKSFLEDISNPLEKHILAENCHLETGPPPLPPAPGTISGTVTYHPPAPLPPNAVILVQLQDISLATPSPTVATPTTIAENKIVVGQRQVPIPFELKFDPAKIDPKHAYAMSARISVGAAPLYVLDTSYRVLTQGNPARIILVLVPAKTALPPSNSANPPTPH